MYRVQRVDSEDLLISAGRPRSTLCQLQPVEMPVVLERIGGDPAACRADSKSLDSEMNSYTPLNPVRRKGPV